MPGTFFEEASSLARTALCAVAGNAPTLPRLFNRFAPGLLVPVGDADGLLYALPPFFDFPEFVYRSICNREPPPRPTTPIGDRGQCFCEAYTIQVEGLIRNNFPACDITPETGPVVSVWGPIQAFRITQTDQQGFVGQAYCRGVSVGNCLNRPFQWVTVWNPGSSTNCPPPQALNVIIERADGLPDDCGEAPLPIEPLPPGGNVFVDNDFTYTDNSQTDINLGDVNVTVETPRIDIDGRVNIPVRLNFSPNVVINGSINLGGEVNFYPGSGPGRGAPGDSPEDAEPVEELPPPPISIPNEPQDDDEPTRNPVIVGVVVTSQIANALRASGIAQSSNPDIYAPNIGFVNFLVQLDSGATAWTEDIPVKNLRQIITCPWPYGAIDVRGTPGQGIIHTLTPIQDVRQVIQDPAQTI